MSTNNFRNVYGRRNREENAEEKMSERLTRTRREQAVREAAHERLAHQRPYGNNMWARTLHYRVLDTVFFRNRAIRMREVYGMGTQARWSGARSALNHIAFQNGFGAAVTDPMMAHMHQSCYNYFKEQFERLKRQALAALEVTAMSQTGGANTVTGMIVDLAIGPTFEDWIRSYMYEYDRYGLDEDE